MCTEADHVFRATYMANHRINDLLDILKEENKENSKKIHFQGFMNASMNEKVAKDFLPPQAPGANMSKVLFIIKLNTLDKKD
jgi:hypothetical protein